MKNLLKPSHLRDELLMLLGFLSFEGFPSENIVSKCADVMNVLLLHCSPIYVYLQILKVYANAKNSTWYQSLACENKVKGHCCCFSLDLGIRFADLTFWTTDRDGHQWSQFGRVVL